MIALKVEKIGDRVAVVLSEEALAALHLSVGDTLQLEPSGDGAFNAATREGCQPAPVDQHQRALILQTTQ